MVDHHSRIPKPGDYFIYEYGRGESVIVLRDQAGEVKAFHNVCRHRGSRLCQHGFDEVRPTEALPDGKPADKVLSMVQLGPSGNTPVFRCVYHAWTYDLDGKLVAFPTGMPADFNAAEYGLHPCHVKTVSGLHLGEPRARRRARTSSRGSAAGKPSPTSSRWRNLKIGDPPQGADEGELEAGHRELPRVLSLLPVAHQVVLGRASDLR